MAHKTGAIGSKDLSEWRSIPRCSQRPLLIAGCDALGHHQAHGALALAGDQRRHFVLLRHVATPTYCLSITAMVTMAGLAASLTRPLDQRRMHGRYVSAEEACVISTKRERKVIREELVPQLLDDALFGQAKVLSAESRVDRTPGAWRDVTVAHSSSWCGNLRRCYSISSRCFNTLGEEQTACEVSRPSACSVSWPSWSTADHGLDQRLEASHPRPGVAIRLRRSVEICERRCSNFQKPVASKILPTQRRPPSQD